MSESRTPLEDTGHNIIIYGRVFKTADVLTDFHESQPYAMIVRITSTTRKVIEPNPNLKVIVRHDADFDVLDVKTYPDNNIQVLHEPAANSTSIAEAAIYLTLECSRNVTILHKTWVCCDKSDNFYKIKLKVRKNTLKAEPSI